MIRSRRGMNSAVNTLRGRSERHMGEPAVAPCREQHALFDTPIGPCGIAWSERGVTRLQLPESDRSGTERRLGANGASAKSQDPPPEVERVIAAVKRYLGGEPVDFSSV